MENERQRGQQPQRPRRSSRPTSTYRRRGNVPPVKRMTYKEKFVLQCIVCSIILASVLLIKIINSDTTNRLKINLNIAMSDNISFDDVKNGTKGIFASLSKMSSSAKDVFGGQPADTNYTDDTQKNEEESQTQNTTERETSIDNKINIDDEANNGIIIDDTYNTDNAGTQENIIDEQNNTQAQPQKNAEQIIINDQFKDNDFRIDEDILDQINNQEDKYINQKKPIAPN